ncbi:MAG: KamA family radical SAM protein [Desulfobacterales bacterium]
MIPAQNKTGDWQSILSASITSAEQLATIWPVDTADVQRVAESFPMRINPYYLGLIHSVQDPIWRQVIPDPSEIEDTRGTDDPLSENEQSPVPHLIHRYPDRVVFLVSNQCATYCRFCLRKRKVGHPVAITRTALQAGIDYIRADTSIREVILSGGDPLLLTDEALSDLLIGIRKCPHITIIRIHTRVPCTLPQRITADLSRMLRSFHPLYINTHFNHPVEITSQSAAACTMLADSGIPLGCQTVLLKGVNDDPKVMKDLMQLLIALRVRPYYIHQVDPVRGACHFSTPLDRGLEIIKALEGHTSGISVPRLMIDLPGGGGKIPLTPAYIERKDKKNWSIRNFEGKVFQYRLVGG